ncbi:hypothetical protein FA15DRAFT_761197 [Coprinopsis marcescibilis]|uniref:Nephrocystin 3-like N-terminal domain-containing protein n=1 Tax=Coprinopsis marcescibilis TaxID=230819 RepID=A0A5C3KAW7_COPMA|nr:hypothetical protein FA15DRAFT_761197 [Coprinopsis marcescibilis]
MTGVVKIRQRLSRWMQNTIGVSETPTRSGVEAFTNSRDVTLQNVNMTLVGGDMLLTNIHHHHHDQQTKTDLGIQEALQGLSNPVGCSWDPSRTCLAGTREQHISKILSWTQSREEGTVGARVMVVADSVGSGKSALAHTICQLARQHETFVAGYFFNQMEWQSTPSNLMTAFIRGLCNISDKVRSGIGEILAKDNSLATASPIQQFEEIIIPIIPLLPSNRHFVIVIDALDEEKDPVVVTLLRNWVSRLPSSFRFIVTTRPEQRIMGYLEKQPHIHRFSHTLTGESNHGDVKIFIQSKLENASYGPDVTPDLLDAFVAKTEGLFLWATTVLNHLEDSYDPIAELKDIVHGKSSHWQEDGEAAPKLENLYLRILSKLKWTDHRFAEKYRIVMGALVVLKDSLTPAGLAALYGQDGITINDIHRICTLLHPLLQDYSSNNSQQPFRLLHLSVQEYLTQRAPSPYRLASEEHDATLSRLALHVLKNELTPTNIPMLGYSGGDWIDEMTTEVPEIPYLSKDAVSEQLWYAGQFVGDHTLSMAIDGLQQSHIHLLRDLVIDSQYILEMTASMGNLIKIGPLRKRTLELLPEAGLDNEVIRRTAKTYLRLASCLKAELYRVLVERDQPRFEGHLAWSLHNIAADLGACGRSDEAVSFSKECVDNLRRRRARKGTDADQKMEMKEGELAHGLLSYGMHLTECRRQHHALEPIQEAVDIYRKLSAVNPQAHERHLANALDALANTYSSTGKHPDALETTQQIVSIARRWGDKDPENCSGPLGIALERLSSRLNDCSRPEDALQASQESLRIFRRLASKSPDKFNVDLVLSLRNVAVALFNTNNTIQAMEFDLEAITIARQLSEQDPKHKQELASALHDAAFHLSLCGRNDDAITFIKEAIDIRRPLAVINPAKFESDLSSSLHSCGSFLTNRSSIEIYREAIEIRTRLANCKPVLFNPLLAQTLHNLSWCLSSLGEHEEAMPPIQEAIAIRRRLVSESPTNFEAESNLANALHAYAIYLTRSDRHQDAVETGKEAISIQRRLAGIDPEAVEDGLAESLHNISSDLALCGRIPEAITYIEEAIEIRRREAATDPVGKEHLLGISLHNYFRLLFSVGQLDQSILVGEETLGVRRRTAKNGDPARLQELAATLHQHAFNLKQNGQPGDATNYNAEAVAILCDLAISDPVTFEPLLASSLHGSAVYLHACGSLLDAVNAGQKAASIYRRLVQTAPEQFARDFLSTISDLAIDLRVCGQHEEAIRVTEDRIAVLRGVAALMDPTKFEPLLGDALHGHAVCLAMCGRNADALEPGQEALEIRHKLALSNPELFNTDLATTLHNMVCDLNACDRQVDAFPYLEELVAVRRQSSEQDPDKHEYPLHGLLYHYATQLAECGRYFEAKERSKDALEPVFVLPRALPRS